MVWASWTASPALFKHIADVTGVVAPLLTFSTVLQHDVDLAGLRQCARTILRSARSSLALSSVGGFFPDSDDFVARLFGEGAQIALLSGTGLVGGGYPAIQRGRLSQLNPSRQTPRKRAFSCGRVLVYSKYTSKGTGGRRSPQPLTCLKFRFVSSPPKGATCQKFTHERGTLIVLERWAFLAVLDHPLAMNETKHQGGTLEYTRLTDVRAARGSPDPKADSTRSKTRRPIQATGSRRWRLRSSAA